MFPLKLKNEIRISLKNDVVYLLESNPEIRTRLNIEPESFSIAYDLVNKKYVKEFIRNNQDIFISKYNQLLEPRLQILADSLGELAESSFCHFVDDFYEYSVYECVETDNVEDLYENLWKKFEEDFFSAKFEMSYIVRFLGIYGATSAGLETVIPYEDIALISPMSVFDYKLVGWERDGDYSYNFVKRFEVPWTLFETKKLFSKKSSLKDQIHEVVDKFNLITFVFRNVTASTVYFNDVRIFGLGYYSPVNYDGLKMFPVYDNDIYQKFEEKFRLTHPEVAFIRSVLLKCNNSNYDSYIFQDWQLKIRRILKVKKNFEWSTIKQKYYLLNCLINLTFVLNSLLPDLRDKNGYIDNRKNKKFRDDYLPKLIHKYFGINEDTVKNLVVNFYEIRNEVAHGNNEDANRLFTLKFNNPENFYDQLLIQEKILCDLIILSLVNLNFKKVMSDWFESGKNEDIPQLIAPYEF